MELLRRARALGDRLIVAINGDDIVEKYKRRPYIKEDDRLAVVQACRYVDEAFVIHTFDNKEVICKYGINIIVHGDDWCGMSYLEQIRLTPEFIQEHQIQLIYLPYTKGISTFRNYQPNTAIFMFYRDLNVPSIIEIGRNRIEQIDNLLLQESYLF